MVGCWYRVLLVLCLVLLGRALPRQKPDGSRDVAIGNPFTEPPIPKPDGSRDVAIGNPFTEPPIPEPLPGNDGPVWALSPTANQPNTKEYPLHEIVMPEKNPEISEGLFEGDIVLTPEEEKLRILQGRKAIGPSYYWPRNSSGIVSVGYRFGDTIVNQTLVMVAIAQWEANTCIRFKPVAATVGTAHLKFMDSTGCSSYVGRIASMTSGQTISLAPSCVTQIGPTVHEIGHALGFHHEQSRSDRDDYVKILYENIQSGKESNFNKKTTYNNGVPYDYWSVMHYGTTYFTSNGNATIAAYDPLAQPLMGNRVGLSFADKRLANIMYSCLNEWLTKCSLSSDPCQNMGYTGPDCNCVCPEGTSGVQCEVLEDSYTDALIKLYTPLSETITTEGVVSTPEYPTPIQKKTKFVKILVAPDCNKVQLTFTDFHVYARSSTTCYIDGLTVQTQDALASGKRYCGSEIAAGTVFTSETNTIVLDYFNYDYTTTNFLSTYRGFSADIAHIPIDGCTTTVPPPPKVTLINSGVVPLYKSSSSSGTCTLTSLATAGSYRFTSPRYSSNYRKRDACKSIFETSEPRYVRVTATTITNPTSERVYIDSLFSSRKEVYSVNKGTSYVLPSSQVNFTFTATQRTRTGRKFYFTIDVINTDCHQIAVVESGASDTVTQTQYAANTICEWWIQAPEGKEIQLVFSLLDVGSATCSNDYLAIDTSGDRQYKTASQRFCGTKTAGTSVTSSGGQLNVLLNGLQGGFPGFTATYSVV